MPFRVRHELAGNYLGFVTLIRPPIGSQHDGIRKTCIFLEKNRRRVTMRMQALCREGVRASERFVTSFAISE